MTKTKKALEKLEAALEEAIERREATYDNRSDEWRESERGEEYMERSCLLQEMHDQVTDWMEEINE